jgi:hypothetical protein
MTLGIPGEGSHQSDESARRVPEPSNEHGTIGQQGAWTAYGSHGSKWLLANAGVAVPIAAALLFILRCFGVSRFDPDTATALMAYTSIGDALHALVLPVFPSLAWLGVGFFAGLLGETMRLSRNWAFSSLAVVLTGILAALISWTTLGWYGAVGISIIFTFVTLRTWANAYLYPYTSGRRFAPAYLGVVTVAMLFAVFTGPMWLPLQQFQTGPRTSIRGYLLRDSEGYAVILKEDPRRVIQLSDSGITRRSFCHRNRQTKYHTKCD